MHEMEDGMCMKYSIETNPIEWKSKLPEQSAHGTQNEDQYLLQNAEISKLYQQNALEEARLDRSMRRDEHRSRLKIEEQREKMIRRELHMEIMEKDGAMYVLHLDGCGKGISFRKVFSAKIKNLECYRYQNSTEVWCQITLLEERTGKEVVSPLYQKEDMLAVERLRKTILSAYECADSTKNRLFFLNCLQRQMLSLLKDAEIVEIPSGPGWYADDLRWHFCSMSDKDTTKYSDYMRNFTMMRFHDLDAGDSLGTLLENLEKSYNQNDVGVLLQYRFGALLGRLTGKPCFRTGLVIFGEKSEQVARFYLPTMANDVDTINLDSDKMITIRKRVCALQDTPVIFLVNDPADRSVRNRLREVISWMRTSRIDGKRVNAPFVFCFQQFSPVLSLDDMLVVDASSIRLLKDDQILNKFQSMVVERVEQAGELYVNEIANRYNSYIEMGCGEAIYLARTVTEVLDKMFDDPSVNILHRVNLRKLLKAGEEEMERQLSRKSGRLSEIFREQVINLVYRGTILVADRDKSPTMDNRKYIYYDSKYYYFTESVLCKIGIWAAIDRKSILAVKQELDSLSMIKKYQAIGRRTEELHVDFRISNAYGERKDLSGIAILREFWDEIGGIKLWEIG